MEKLFFLLLLCALSPLLVAAQKLEKYCEMISEGKAVGKKVTVSIRYGNDSIQELKFNMNADALNYMGRNGWKLVEVLPVSEPASLVRIDRYYFKKEYDTSELNASPE